MRRFVYALTCATALTSVAVLPGCSGSGTTTSPIVISAPKDFSAAASDLSLVASGLSAALQSSGLAVPAADTGYLNDLALTAKDLSAADSTAMAQPVVQRAEADLNQFVADLGSKAIALPPGLQTAVTAAQALLPVVEVAVNLVVKSSAGPDQMSPAKARDALHAAISGALAPG